MPKTQINRTVWESSGQVRMMGTVRDIPSGSRANTWQPSSVASKPSEQTLYTNNSSVDARKLAKVQDELHTGRKEAGKAVACKDKRPGFFSSLLRSIKAFFAGSPPRSNSEVRKQAEAGAETPKIPPFQRKLGELPFVSFKVQPQDDFELSDGDKKNIDAQFKDSEERLEKLVGGSPPMTPRSCLAGVLLISGVFKLPDQFTQKFEQEFMQASDWKTHTSAHGPWRSLAIFGDPEINVLNTNTIKLRINLCRMTADRVSPEFLKKFDEAAKIESKEDDGTWKHGVTKENYWEVITAIQTLAWNELKASAS